SRPAPPGRVRDDLPARPSRHLLPEWPTGQTARRVRPTGYAAPGLPRMTHQSHSRTTLRWFYRGCTRTRLGHVRARAGFSPAGPEYSVVRLQLRWVRDESLGQGSSADATLQ